MSSVKGKHMIFTKKLKTSRQYKPDIKKKHHIKKSHANLLLMFIVFILATGFTPNQIEVKPLNIYTNLLINHYDGYSMQIPSYAKISLIDSHYLTQVDFDTTNIKIFAQPLKTSYEGYLNYSLRGIRNTASEHIISYDGYIQLGGKYAHEISFTRRKLTALHGDKNHYMIVFSKINSNLALTFMVKSSEPIDKGRVLPMLSSIKFDQPKIRNVPEKVPASYKYSNGALQGAQELSQDTAEFYQRYFLGSDMSWGLFANGFWADNVVKDIENYIDREFKFMLLYHDLDSGLDQIYSALDYCIENDKYLELTLQTGMKDGKNEIYDVLCGSYDSYLKNMAKIIAQKKHPTIFRLANEMNGDWCTYSAYNTGLDSDIYKQFYKYVHDIFEKEGANKYILYVFNPNGKSFPDFRYNDESVYRPDSDKYQLIGLTLYNTGNYYPGERFIDFTSLYKDLYDKVEKNYDKPMMITEFACSTSGGDKVAWTRDMLSAMKYFPKIKVAIWFHGVDKDAYGNPARVYLIDEPRENLTQFRDYFSFSN